MGKKKGKRLSWEDPPERGNTKDPSDLPLAPTIEDRILEVKEELKDAPLSCKRHAEHMFPKIKSMEKLKFLYALARTGINQRHACRVSGVHPSTVYLWKRKDPDFAEAWEAAMNVGFQEFIDFGLEWAQAVDPRWRSERLYIKFLESYGGDKFTGKQQVEHSVHAKMIERGSERDERRGLPDGVQVEGQGQGDEEGNEG